MNEKKESPSFYAIIPANVRYDKTLPPNAKLLYGEITALCDQKGFCWATNGYFADLYGVSKVSISKWVRSLSEAGYISVELKYGGNKEILGRYLTLVYDPIKEKFNTPIKEKFKGSTTVINNTISNTPIVPKSGTGEKLKTFDLFWEQYPRKVAKGSARKLWLRKSFPLDEIQKALNWQKESEEWTKERGVFIPHPATYLNAERWTDNENAKESEEAKTSEIFKKHFGE